MIEERRLKVSQVLCQRIREKGLAERETASERARESDRESARERERAKERERARERDSAREIAREREREREWREMSLKTTATCKYRIQTRAILKKKNLPTNEKADACKESVTKAH